MVAIRLPAACHSDGKAQGKNAQSIFRRLHTIRRSERLERARLGLTRAGIEGFDSLNPTPQVIIDKFNEAVDKLRAAGATVIDLDAQGFTFP